MNLYIMNKVKTIMINKLIKYHKIFEKIIYNKNKF